LQQSNHSKGILMKKEIQNKLFLLAFLACLMPLWTGCRKKAKPSGAPPKRVTITLYHTSDLHETSDPIPRIAQFVKDRKTADANVLLFDTGDWFNKGDLTRLNTRGQAMVAMMGACPYDGVISGNHDYSFGTVRLVELLVKQRIPFLACNCDWPEGMSPPTASTYKVFQLSGVRVGVIGAATTIGNHAQDDFLKIKEIVPSVREILSELQDKADILVLLTHQGGETDHALAAELSELDVILGGHDHGVYHERILEPGPETFLMHSGHHGEVLGELVLTWDGTSIVDRKIRHIPITESMKKDPRVEAVRLDYVEPEELPEAEGF